ncbi:MAG TPA: peptide ABC transporter substrate-binding protein [Thermoflexia bacterium]|nr:peptide ABC transporter substrate-binding protein [Thermoflexia bacterium]
MPKKKLWVLVIIISSLALGLTACLSTLTAPPAEEEPPAVATATETLAPPTATPEPTPTATPLPPKTLVICQQHEPTSLYWYSNSRLVARHIHEALYDGPIDNLGYTHQPVILEKIPSLRDRDAKLKQVIVQAGDKVVDAYNEPVELAEGMLLFPSGCRSAACAVEFTGEPVEMDQLEVTFRLKANIKWSDGEPLTAQDSVYGYELRQDPETPVSKYTELRTASYEATDELTTRWTGLPGYFDQSYELNFYQPLPRHLWQAELGYEAADLLTAPEANRTPLGWGAFTIHEWIAGDHLTLTPNPHYFRASEGLPHLDTLIYRFVGDANTALAQLLSGECDIVTQDADLASQYELLIELQEHGVAEPFFSPGPLWEHVNFGIMPAAEYKQPSVFADLRMRQAVAYCLDRQRVVSLLRYGRTVIPDSYLPAEHPLYAAELVTHYPYTPEKGRALLEEVGWQDTDEDGIREAHAVPGARNGTPLEITWTSTSQTLHKQYMELFRQDLAECGIQLQLENLPLPEFFAQSASGPLFGRNFELSSFAWSAGTEIPPCELYLSTEIPNEENNWSGSNFSGFSNEEYDAACEQAQQSLPGADEYVAAHQEAQRIFSEQLPALPLFLRLNIAVTRSEVLGFTLDPTAASELWNVEELDLQQ